MGKSAIEVVELVYLAILVLLILTGNSLVILAFHLGSRRLRTYTNYFVVNLAVCDLMVGILSVPLWMYVRIDESAYNNIPAFSKVFLASDILFGCGSILSLTVISIERMVAVKYPARHFNLTLRPIVIAIATIWFFAVLLAGLSTFGRSNALTSTLFVISFFIPALIILYSYVIIFMVARETVASSSRKIIKEVRVAKMVSVIIGLFISCWLPFFVVNLLYVYCKDWCDTIPLSLVHFSKILHYSNSMMNVIVYAVRSPDFRSAFKALIKSRGTRARSESRLPRFRSRTLTNPDSCANEEQRSMNTNGRQRNGWVCKERTRTLSASSEKARSPSRGKGELDPLTEASFIAPNENPTPM